MNSSLFFTTDKFYYFYWICKLGSIQATSRKLNLSAPTLSVTIKKLEMAFGVTLFLRTKNGMILTKHGNILYKFCEKFYYDLEHLSQDMHDQGENKKFRIKMGTFQSIALYFFPLLLKELETHENISLSVRTDRSYIIQELLIKDEIDLALTVESSAHQKLTSIEIYNDSFSFFASSKDSDFKQNKKYTLNDLRKFLVHRNLIYMPSAIDKNGNNLENHIRSMGIDTQNTFELDSLEVIAKFTLNNNGIGILPNLVAQGYGKYIKKIQLDNSKYSNFCSHGIHLTYRNNLDLPSQIIKGIILAAQNSAKKLGEGSAVLSRLRI